MGIKFGEIDASQILENEFQSKFTAKILEWLFDNNPNLKRPTPEQIKDLQDTVVKELQKKYPNSGIKLQQ